MAATRANDVRTGAFETETDNLLANFQANRPLRTGSLVISVFGDAIAPHGGAVWLGSLISALEPFGINSRLMRTTVFRLAKDGWLQSEQIGRRSYYSLTPDGRSRFQEASGRIYSEPRRDWSGNWCLLLLSGVSAEEREDIRKEMRWLGFAPFSANVLAHPAPNIDTLDARLDKLPGADKLLVMTANTAKRSEALLKALVHESWELQDLDEKYAEFLEQFRPLYAAARNARGIDPELAFRVRVLLFHEYRKILLRDPFLPDALLPERWSGVAAYQLCRNIYSLVASPAEEFLTEAMETEDGPLPPAEPSYYQRFGGLGDTF